MPTYHDGTALQGAWAQLLMRLTGHHGVAFGTAVVAMTGDPGRRS